MSEWVQTHLPCPCPTPYSSASRGLLLPYSM